MTRDFAIAMRNDLDAAIERLTDLRDNIANEFIRCETCGGKVSGPPCYGIKPTQSETP